MPMKRHQPTKETRSTVEAMVASGCQQSFVAKSLGVAEKTLRRHYRTELDTGAVKANLEVARTLFEMATSGKHPAATFFWLKMYAPEINSLSEAAG